MNRAGGKEMRREEKRGRGEETRREEGNGRKDIQ
jgi:hypothetical protein